jgi:hypothetical protein
VVDDHASYPFVNCLPESDEARKKVNLSAWEAVELFELMSVWSRRRIVTWPQWSESKSFGLISSSA